MSDLPAPSARLPENPSAEHLRKQAKRLAKAERLKLAVAQSRIARDYGFRNWPELVRAVAVAQPAARLSPLSAAARAGDADAVARLLAEGASADGEPGETALPLVHACAADAPFERRLGIVTALLEAGAHIRNQGPDGTMVLHAAAAAGPMALVELLIRRGAVTWLADAKGKTPLDRARAGTAPDKVAIVELLDRPVIRDPGFRAAVEAIRAGDIAALLALLDARPELLRIRAVEPDCYDQDYFRDPKLFWFIAGNPSPPKPLPPNIVAVAQAMIARGVESSDLDYALELVMTNNEAREQGYQAPMIKVLLEAGATAHRRTVMVTLAHRELDAVAALLDGGMAMTAPIAAALGRDEALAALLAEVAPEEQQTAFGMAVINNRVEAARRCLAAGADVNAFLPIHRHSTAMHDAAGNGHMDLLRLLVAHGGRTDIRDTLWDGLPIGWALHGKQPEAAAYLRSLDDAGASA